MIRYCEFCGNKIDNIRQKFGQTYFYYCPNCKIECSSIEALQKYNPNLRSMNEKIKNKILQRHKCINSH